MSNVFISYRRGETAGEARALFKDLTAVLGSDSVFMDVDTIALGRDFRDVVRERLDRCDLMLALVGRNWVAISDQSGHRRLEDPNDFVRLEIETALKRGIPVIPVLVQGAQMPTLDQLPSEIRSFTFRNAFELSHNRWESDIHELLRRLAIDRQDPVVHAVDVSDRSALATRRGWLIKAGPALLGAALVVGTYAYFDGYFFNTAEPEQGPSVSVIGAIRDKWAALGMEMSPLGRAVSEETPTYDGVGRSQQFQGGIISWHPETGAHVVWGLIGERWLQLGRERFGYPVTDEIVKPDGRGRAADFRAVQLPGKPIASIYWTPDTGAHEVVGAIRDRWIEMGAERSALGYPVSPEQEQRDGRIQRFQNGSLFWTPQAGVVPQ